MGQRNNLNHARALSPELRELMESKVIGILEVMSSTPVGVLDVFFVPRLCHVDQFSFHIVPSLILTMILI